MHTSAFIFGVLAGLSIGPIAVLILNLALTYGPRSAVLAGLGAALGDLVWGMTAFLGGSALSAAFIGREYYFKALCSALLIGIAIWMLWIAVRRLRAGALPDAGDAARATERYGALLGTFGLTCQPVDGHCVRRVLGPDRRAGQHRRSLQVGTDGFLGQSPCAGYDCTGGIPHPPVDPHPASGFRGERRLAGRSHRLRALGPPVNPTITEPTPRPQGPAGIVSTVACSHLVESEFE